MELGDIFYRIGGYSVRIFRNERCKVILDKNGCVYVSIELRGLVLLVFLRGYGFV